MGIGILLRHLRVLGFLWVVENARRSASWAAAVTLVQRKATAIAAHL